MRLRVPKELLRRRESGEKNGLFKWEKLKTGVLNAQGHFLRGDLPKVEYDVLLDKPALWMAEEVTDFACEIGKEINGDDSCFFGEFPDGRLPVRFARIYVAFWKIPVLAVIEKKPGSIASFRSLIEGEDTGGPFAHCHAV